MGEFSAWLGAKRRAHSARSDGHGKPFRLATAAHAPQAAILFDKSMSCGISAKLWIRFARANMDDLRRDRRYIKGQKYTLLSRKEPRSMARGH